MDIIQAQENARLVAMERIAKRCQRDLFYLVKNVLATNSDLITEHTHRELCEMTRPLLPEYDSTESPAVEVKTRLKPNGEKDEVLSDQFDPNKNKLLIQMPRGTFKSSIVTIGFTLQYLLNDGDARVLIDSETYSKAKNFLAEIKGHLEDNKKFRDIFKYIHGVYPDENKKDPSVRWTDGAVDLSCRKKKRKEASITCSGIDRSINGMHFDLIIADDLHSEKNVTTKDQIEQTIDHYKLCFSLLDPGCPMIVIGTRWDYQDLYQYMLENERHRYNIIIRKAIEDDGSLLFPERLTEQFLEETKKIQGNYIFSCTPGDAKILMADLTEKPISEVRVGDEIVGYSMGNNEKRGILKKTKVTEVNSRIAPVQKVFFESGSFVRCTPDHQWFTGRLDATHKQYLPAKVGRTMLRVLDEYEEPTQEELLDWRWLGGVIDGEGSCKNGGNIFISQSYKHNPAVHTEIERVLKRLKIDYRKYDHKNKQCTMFHLKGGRSLKARILRYAKPAKKDQILKGFTDYKSRIAIKKEKVQYIIPQGEERVYALTTDTGNYISQNIASKNCQYLNSPVDDETATFKQSYIRYTTMAEIEDRPINWYMAIDPSFEGQYSDYAAFVLVGMDYMQELYVRQIHRAKMNYSQIINLMFDWYHKYQPRAIALETIATQKNIQYMLNNEQKNRGIWLPVKEIKSRTATKESRIEALAPYYEFGRVHHIKESNQLDELEYELLHFPKGSHDDVIDALATILEIASPPNEKRARRERDRTRKRTFDKPRSPVTGI